MRDETARRRDSKLEFRIMSFREIGEGMKPDINQWEKPLAVFWFQNSDI